MRAKLKLYCESAEELDKVMRLIRETGIEILTIQRKFTRRKLPRIQKEERTVVSLTSKARNV